MTKKVIQIPLDEDLLRTLDGLSRSRHESRSELVREACRRYIRALQQDQMDRVYEEGYRRLPESASVAEAQTALASRVLEEERW
jgi:metal-responsive CopG/Arc/MetJ family transcriptional regulator